MKSDQRWLLLTAAIVASALLAPVAEAAKDAYRFKFGLMTPSPQGNSVVYLETTQIEKHADPSYGHGFSIKRKDGAQFYIYYIVRFPEPLQDLPEGIERYYQVLDGGKALQSNEELVWEMSRSFVFSESDPTGVYKLEVYTDSELYRSIDYDVLPVPKYSF